MVGSGPLSSTGGLIWYFIFDQRAASCTLSPGTTFAYNQKQMLSARVTCVSVSPPFYGMKLYLRERREERGLPTVGHSSTCSTNTEPRLGGKTSKEGKGRNSFQCFALTNRKKHSKHFTCCWPSSVWKEIPHINLFDSLTAFLTGK